MVTGDGQLGLELGVLLRQASVRRGTHRVAVHGTHHGVSPQHLQSYLDEYVFRFNRRFYPMTAFNSVLGLAAHTVAPTYEELYAVGDRHVAA